LKERGGRGEETEEVMSGYDVEKMERIKEEDEGGGLEGPGEVGEVRNTDYVGGIGGKKGGGVRKEDGGEE